MKKGYLLLAIAASLSACGQKGGRKGNPHSEQVLAQAKEMGQLLIKKDFNNYIKFVSPAVTNAVGGTTNMIQILKQSTEQMEGQGYAFKSVTFGTPSEIIDTANTLQCIIPETLKMGTPEGDMLNYTSLLALSTDKGKTWVFAEANQAKLPQLKMLLPVISSRHIIPEGRTEKVK